MNRFLRSAVALCVVLCGAGCREKLAAGNRGFLRLNVEYAQDFDPNATHGRVVQYKVTASGDSLPSPRIEYFPEGTQEALLDGFAAGTRVTVTVEYVNANGVTVRRGRTGEVEILGGETLPVALRVNNVPVFANVADGATLFADRFVPRVFAPGVAAFEIVDESGGDVRSLSDLVSGEVTFSVSPGDADSVLPVYAGAWTPGEHRLTVRDVETGEASEVSVTVVAKGDGRVWATSAGSYAGTLAGGRGLGLLPVHRHLTQPFAP